MDQPTRPTAVPDPEPAEHDEQVRIVITFAGPGLADHRIDAHGCDLAQVAAAAWVLDAWAHELRASIHHQVASKIEVVRTMPQGRPS
jgi:hypothetical protein